jgi:hypothetical protein
MLTKTPFIIALLTLISGVVIAILFGANEDYFKNKIAQDLQQNEKILSIEDPNLRKEKVSSEKDKNWRYYQRFHFHATGIGAMSLGVLLLIFLINAPRNLKAATAYMISIGGFLYPFLWLFSAIYGPVIGRSEAKEAFSFFGYMGGVFLFGLFLALFILIKYPFYLTTQSEK